ncbi:MAG: hypothetical protein JRE23_17300 [Deltaproteobacteria bacterium]|nr:hypothetical protein [Deltaproteobacteria bacterium]
MDFQKTVEKYLTDEDQWEWHEGARYRIKQVKDSVWYGLQILQEGDQIKAKPIIAYVGTRVKLTKVDIPFLELDEAFNQLENTRKNALTLSNSPKSPLNPIHSRKA